MLCHTVSYRIISYHISYHIISYHILYYIISYHYFILYCIIFRESRGVALLFHDYGTSRWWGVSVTSRPLFTPGKDPVPIVQDAGWAPCPVWTGAENLFPTGIRSPDCPAPSQSLYRLSYPAHITCEAVVNRSGWQMHINWVTSDTNLRDKTVMETKQSLDPFGAHTVYVFTE
jgi:hypothetical protein